MTNLKKSKNVLLSRSIQPFSNLRSKNQVHQFEAVFCNSCYTAAERYPLVNDLRKELKRKKLVVQWHVDPMNVRELRTSLPQIYQTQSR